MEFSVSKRIEAAPEAVWRVLVEAGSYPDWDPNIERIDGTIALGNKITVHTKLSSQAFPVKVTVLEAPKIMVWTGGMPLGLFKGERTFALTDTGDGATEFTMREVFSGLLLGLIGRSIPDLSQSFEEFAAGLKARVESKA